MWKIFFVVLLIQNTSGKKKNTTLQQTATTKITQFIDDATDFLSDILYNMSIFIGLEKPHKTKDSWTIDNVVKYTYSSFNTGYKVVKDSIPILKMARANIESVSTILPNVSISTIIEHILVNLTPELMKTVESNE